MQLTLYYQIMCVCVFSRIRIIIADMKELTQLYYE